MVQLQQKLESARKKALRLQADLEQMQAEMGLKLSDMADVCGHLMRVDRQYESLGVQYELKAAQCEKASSDLEAKRAARSQAEAELAAVEAELAAVRQQQ